MMVNRQKILKSHYQRMQINMKYHFTAVRIHILGRQEQVRVRMWGEEHFYTVGGVVDGFNPFGKQFAASSEY